MLIWSNRATMEREMAVYLKCIFGNLVTCDVINKYTECSHKKKANYNIWFYIYVYGIAYIVHLTNIFKRANKRAND